MGTATGSGLVFIITSLVFVSGFASNGTEPEDTVSGNAFPERPVVPKCCPAGQRLLSREKCAPSALEFVPAFMDASPLDSDVLPTAGQVVSADVTHSFALPEEGEYTIIVGNPCQHGRYRLEPSERSTDEFHLLSNGSLLAPFLFDGPLPPSGFCMEVFPDTISGTSVVLPLVCFPPEVSEDNPEGSLQFIIYPAGLILSLPFLLATLLAYAITPALRDVHGKALMCHVVCLIVAFTSLAVVQLSGSRMPDSLCVVTAFVIQFSFIGCFMWMHVMCINTWWNVRERWRRPQRRQTRSRRRERRRFVLYSMYAWGVALLLIAAAMVIDLAPSIPTALIKPRFGMRACWFQDDAAAVPYFYGPLTAIVSANVILFGLTAATVCRCYKKANKPEDEDNITKEQDEADNHAFQTCFLLFCAMGVPWIMEFISWFIGGPRALWYLTDILNTLQGVVIFCVFVLSKRVRRLVSERSDPYGPYYETDSV